jgi:hypothetical protein
MGYSWVWAGLGTSAAAQSTDERGSGESTFEKNRAIAVAQVPRTAPPMTGLASTDHNPGDRRHRGEDRDHQEGDRAPLDPRKLLARARAYVAATGDAPDMLASRRHSLHHRVDPGGKALARLAQTNPRASVAPSTRARSAPKAAVCHSDDRGRANPLLAQTIRKAMQNCSWLSSTRAGL